MRLRPALLLALALIAAAAEALPPVPPVLDQAALGVGIQRTMTLLSGSTPERRNRVRILFYGQSITQQEWAAQVADDLRRRFPHADLETRNLAIGGFASQWLVRTFEHDLPAFYPDLVVFHVYGGDREYEEIIRGIRSRTTAEVLMQTDHLTAWPSEARDEADLQRLHDRDLGAWWSERMNRSFLPGCAGRYGCGLADVRSEWERYLRANRLEPRALLKDDVHLNASGCAVMAGIVGQYLVHRPDLPHNAWQDLTTELVVGRDLTLTDGRLTVPFTGNRIDVLAGPAAQPVRAEFTIDGRTPSSFAECQHITRPEPGPWSPLFIRRVGHDAPLLPEDWTLTVTTAAEGKGWSFAVQGSVTGVDGSGSSERDFRSDSGRVVLAAADWFHPRDTALTAGFRMTWSVRALCADHADLAQADPARETAVTVAQGLANGPHVLELRCASAPGQAIRAIRIYRPPVGR